MGEKLYRPILKDGDHLVQSTKNPDRVRGQSRDANNKNPDLIEWEPVEVEARLLSLRHLDIEFDITVVFFIYLRRHVTVLLFIPEEAK